MIRTIAEHWPTHADHHIVYSEHGRTDYTLTSVEVTDFDSVIFVEVNDISSESVGGKINDTEVWCETCGEQLDLDGETVETTPA